LGGTGGGDKGIFSEFEVEATGEDAMASMSRERSGSRLDFRGGYWPGEASGLEISCLGDIISSFVRVADSFWNCSMMLWISEAESSPESAVGADAALPAFRGSSSGFFSL
jgi:hypothetical protein